MTGIEVAAIISLILSMLPITSFVLLVWYLITGNDTPFLKFYGFTLGVKLLKADEEAQNGN